MGPLFWRIFLAIWAAVVCVAVGSVVIATFAIERDRDRLEGEGFARRVDALYAGARTASRNGGLEGLKTWAREIDRTELMPVLVIGADGRDILGRRSLRGLLTRARAPDPFGGPSTRVWRERGTGGGGDAPPPPPIDSRTGRPVAPPAEPGGGFAIEAPPGAGAERDFGEGGVVFSLPLADGAERPPPDVIFELSVPDPIVADGQRYVILPDPRSLTLWRTLRHPPLALLWFAVALTVTAVVAWPLTRSIVRPIPLLRAATRAVSGGYLGMRIAPLLEGRRDELGELAHDFDAMSARVEELLRSHRQLLVDMSHELRSPLARMFVALELARKHAEPRTVAELDRVERETKRLSEIIEKILTLGRLEASPGPTARGGLDLDALLAELCAELGAAGGAPVRYAGPGAPIEVVGDAAWLRTAFSNLVQNAQRYARPDTAVDVRAARDGAAVRVAVRDRGPGVPPDMLERIFEPFVRVAEARDRGSGGYGLGLSIVKRVLDAHGGRIAARNAPDGGLEVEVELPAAGT